MTKRTGYGARLASPCVPGLQRHGAALRRPLAAAALTLALLAPLGAAADALALRAQRVALNPNDPAQSAVGALDYLGGVSLSADDRRFGGLSGLDVSADGARLVAVSDRGYWITARLEYDRRGRLIGIGAGRIHRIVGTSGRPVSGPWRDAEDIARLTDGSMAVSFERRHRILLYPADGPLEAATPRPFFAPAGLRALPPNGGLEAVTVLADGRLLAVAEKARQGTGVRGWLIAPDGEASEPLVYGLARSQFRPTSLATLANGDVLALERHYSPVTGVAVRVVHIERATIAPRATLSGNALATFKPPLTVDNFEGLAVRRSADGASHVYLVSDDNYSPFQRTLLLHLRWREGSRDGSTERP